MFGPQTHLAAHILMYFLFIAHTTSKEATSCHNALVRGSVWSILPGPITTTVWPILYRFSSLALTLICSTRQTNSGSVRYNCVCGTSPWSFVSRVAAFFDEIIDFCTREWCLPWLYLPTLHHPSNQRLHPSCLRNIAGALGLKSVRTEYFMNVQPEYFINGWTIARMQNKLCDVTKCLTTVAAGVLSGRDRKKKLETGLLFKVLLLDQQISFGVRLFFVTRCPHVLLVTCQKAQTWKNCANGASFRVKMCSWSNDVFVELMGEEDAKTPVLYVGNCLFTGS